MSAMTSEKSKVSDLPGGWLAFTLLAFGGIFLFGSLVLGMAWLASPGTAGLGSEGWIIPVWGTLAVAFALGLRRSPSMVVRAFAAAWALIGAGLVFMVLFGTSITTNA